jgi:hypothetical protein
LQKQANEERAEQMERRRSEESGLEATEGEWILKEKGGGGGGREEGEFGRRKGFFLIEFIREIEY